MSLEAPAPFDATATRPEVLRLDCNEGARTRWRRYPDVGPLEKALAARWDLDPARVLVAAGGDDVIDRACRACLGPSRPLLLPVPSFEMIPRYARQTGADITTVPWRGAFPTQALLALAPPEVGLACIVSPNNPTGAVATLDDVRALSRGLPNALILLDHAYVEYADEDLTRDALALPNVVVLRTFSKAWGLAGCRVGYALGEPARIESLRRVGAPYAVSAPSLAAVRRRLLRGERQQRAHIARVRYERDELERALNAMRIYAPASHANFVLCETGTRTGFLHAALHALGVEVRRLGGADVMPEALRISLPGDVAEFDRLLDALRVAANPQALLFDLDGVLADVTGSQLECIRHTASTYGVVLEHSEIRAAQLEPHANDDWALTHRLMTRRGVAAPREQVTRRYQERYRGGAGVPGLCEREALLVPRATIARLARRLPLALVTGRPREEAEAFLARHDLRRCFVVVTCREDAPLKPDPAPVRRTMERLGVSRGWMVGDLPDDVAAARGAGVLPLAFSPAAPENAAALLAAGAAEVLASLDALEGLLP